MYKVLIIYTGYLKSFDRALNRFIVFWESHANMIIIRISQI